MTPDEIFIRAQCLCRMLKYGKTTLSIEYVSGEAVQKQFDRKRDMIQNFIHSLTVLNVVEVIQSMDQSKSENYNEIVKHLLKPMNNEFISIEIVIAPSTIKHYHVNYYPKKKIDLSWLVVAIIIAFSYFCYLLFNKN